MVRFHALLRNPLTLAALVALGAAACSSSTKTSATPTTAATVAPTTTPTTTPTAATAFVATHTTVAQIASTVPANGDVNPYGAAVVPDSVGKLVAGDTLVSNFNNKANVQGTGTTIVQVSPAGSMSTFATISSLPATDVCPGGVGLTTALGILPGGWVVVGSMPTATGGALPQLDPAGCMIVLDDTGAVAETWSNPNINGPWDLAIKTTTGGAAIFISNVYTRVSNAASTQVGPCTFVRLDITLSAGAPPQLARSTVIGSGFNWMANQAALVQGPTGVAIGADGTLYGVETTDNSITAFPNALTATTAVAAGQDVLTKGGFLNGPLGMTIAPNGDLIVANGGDGNVVEVTAQGRQIAKATLVADGAGDLFGVAMSPDGHSLLFVNDGTNTLDRAS